MIPVPCIAPIRAVFYFPHVKFLATYLLLSLLCGSLAAQPLVYDFSGNDAIGSGSLRGTLEDAGISQYSAGVRNRIVGALLSRYSEEGYYAAEITTVECDSVPVDDEIRCIVEINEGPLFQIAAIELAHKDSVDEAALREAFDSEPGDVFSQSAIEQDIVRLLGVYEREGYPFASANVDDIRVEDSAGLALVTVRIAIEEGEPFYINEISIEGNKQTNKDVIVRETRIEKGERFNEEKVGEVKRRGERLNFFNSVSDPTLYMREGRGGLLIRVEEGNTNLFDGIIGYQPGRTEDEPGFVTGLVNVSFRNLFGTGRWFNARWERATQEVTELELGYLEPWLFSLPLNLQGNYYQRQQDSLYIRRTFTARATYLATSTLSFSANASTAAVIPALTTTTVNTLNNSSTLTGGLELRLDTRDNIYNPLSGIILRNYFSGGNKSFTRQGTGEKVTDFIQRIEFDVHWFHQLWPRHIIAISLHGRDLNGNELDISDLYRVGGANTLRGYREEQFTGTTIGWTNLEYRFSLGRRSFAFAFFDLGYIFQEEDERYQRPRFDESKTGYGIGGRLETGLGVMGVSYALGEGDSFDTGKIHFALVNEF